MKVEIVGKEVIKPSSPTIETFSLSFLDQQLYGCAYIKLFYFYRNTSGDVADQMIFEKTRYLKSSLSEVLTLYYPLAGKIKDIYSICSGEDDGVEFLEARVNGTLTKYLEEPNVDVFSQQLVPADYWESSSRPLLVIQASFFTCGGLAIGINYSHRVADIATVTCFMKAWANTAMGKFNNVVRPDFSGSIIFPPSNQFWGMKSMEGRISKPNIVTRRFVFSASNIIGLQEKATKQGIRQPSRVLTVTAFLWRIGMKMQILKTGRSLPSMIVMPISIRRILPPPICDQSFGNFIEVFTVHNDSGTTEISNLINLLKEKIDKIRKTYQEKILQGQKCFTSCLGSPLESMELAFREDIPNRFATTSWCGSPLYDADFGWGKPTWVANEFRGPNWFVPVDTSDGTGIEAWVSFAEEDMAVLTCDEELLTYVTLEPSVL